ncbi:hypothetical protein DFP72DRAFT_817422 [Ephemerocybe angulata]|uniref:Cyclin N-terminal domain-containing protein n=1 Tax=Ephemerocybe angulata TaxID=980116 RepID=A0A8H6HR08_9AGAR|nr:hypothetical protein DFP72DRAFT_817422 [Tulosesus angulatus]
MPPLTPDPFYGQEARARLCSRFIIHVFGCPEDHPTKGRVFLPALPLYIAKILWGAALQPCISTLALVLILRLKARIPSSHGNSGHRLFVSAIMIATKTLVDETYTNKSWKQIIGPGFSLRELNQMEREMCRFLEWDFLVENQDLIAFEKIVVAGFSRDSRDYPIIPLALISKRFRQALSIGHSEYLCLRRYVAHFD